MKSGKITERESETTDPIGWSYNDACGAAHALDLVGERWTLLAMRELMMGPKRFTDLRASLPGISANVLTQRLTKLEAVGVVERVTLPPPAGRAYQLTPWGYEARPIFMVLGRWGSPLIGAYLFRLLRWVDEKLPLPLRLPLNIAILTPVLLFGILVGSSPKLRS